MLGHKIGLLCRITSAANTTTLILLLLLLILLLSLLLLVVVVPLGRPRRRWGDNIKMDLQEVEGGCEDWMELAQDRDRWRALVRTVMNLRVQICGEFLD